MTIPRCVVVGLCILALPGRARAQSADERAIRALIEQHAAASQSRDFDGLVRLYHANAEMISATGRVTAGRGAIEEAYAQLLASPSAVAGRHHLHPTESIRIRFLSTDVALVELLSRSTGGADAEGKTLADTESLLITAWTKLDGVWAVSYQRSVPVAARTP